ncbi:winged helix-turn-helix transcriptional regulator [Brachybacterium sp. EF45031]|uniref:MarR family winged helix-turn-helix transcriptional regulator n=1 Tax=Brachybacterium sillae TaxID=2810536 RepID=UPI00217E3617|nr:MarR family winged helix-turn-helix transcriptional regulator [Brachybacterium sillae]MCS6712645.1 winged helix-turn-helix transcriptional regulator [Brachybacterium sillae]
MPTPPPRRPDEVDRILAGWERARPDLDTTPMAVMSRVHRLARHLEAARREAFTRAELEAWEFDVLAALRRTDGGVASPGELLRSTLVTSGTMTTRLDKLERRGLVRRERDERDRRSVRVHLEAAGAAAVDTAIEGLLAAERTLLAPLGTAEATALAGALRALLLQFEDDPVEGS